MKRPVFDVVYRPEARIELLAIIRWINERSPHNALLVWNRLDRRIASLCTMPRRFPVMPRRRRFGLEVRCLVESSIRVEFVVRDQCVIIVRVSHAASLPPTRD